MSALQDARAWYCAIVTSARRAGGTLDGSLLHLPQKEVARLTDLLAPALIAVNQGEPRDLRTVQAGRENVAEIARIMELLEPAPIAVPRTNPGLSQPTQTGDGKTVWSDEALVKYRAGQPWRDSKVTLEVPADAPQRLRGVQFSIADNLPAPPGTEHRLAIQAFWPFTGLWRGAFI